MGMLKLARTELVDDARRAYEAGQAVFCPRLLAPKMPTLRDGDVGWGETISAIEAAGWRLEQWAVTESDHEKARAYPLFRRA